MHNFKTILTSSLFLFALFIIPASTNAQVIVDSPTNFITTWNTENPGSSGSNQITIPGTGVGYNYEIYWEDTASSTINGTTTLITTASHTLTFPAPGIYEVQIAGDFPRIYFNNGGDKDKILTVEQWGDIAWTSMDSAFFGASNLRVPATDAPDLSGVTSMYSMFHSATAFDDPINHWNVSSIENLRTTFASASSFNQPLDDWNVSSVNTLRGTFYGASSFNQNINSWDVSEVQTLFWTFREATDFNQPLDDWVTSSLENLNRTFLFARSFNQNINSWNVSSVRNMEVMFWGASAFNQPLNTWNTASATTMLGMFNDSNFDQDLSNWDVSNITSASKMFQNTTLSQTNLDNTLTAWAAQTLQPNVPFHLGLKTYSATGATALNTLRDTYGWTITEQYKAEYYPSANAALFGDNVQTGLNLGDTTTEVTLTPKSNCTFLQWSDGSTSNPRTDTIGTSNINVTAELSCSSSGSATRATTQRDRSRAYGNEANAQMIEERFLTSSTTPTARQTPTTIEESLDEVRAVSATIDQIVAADSSPETIRTLIAILLSLIEILTRLMVIDEVSG